MDKIVMYIMAAGAVIGGVDRLLGNRLGLGRRFEEGFMLLGPTALSMAGIICLTPVIASALESAVVPLWQKIGLDPGMLGGILAIDMGGYQLSADLAASEEVGLFSGIIVSSTLGCTVSFTIPVGMGMLRGEDKPAFAKGMLIGLATLPAALLGGAVMCGMSAVQAVVQSLPVLALCVLLMAGLWKFPDGTIRVFGIFAWFIRFLATAGLVLGAVQYMTGLEIIKNLTPIEDAMAAVSSIGVVMLGSLCVAEILQRALKKPLAKLSEKTGMNAASAAGLLIGIVSVMAGIAQIKDMDQKGKVVNAAFLVSAASALAAHVGFTFGVNSAMVTPLLCAKALGGAAAVTAAILLGNKIGKNA